MKGGQVRIHYEEVGSGFPLPVIPGGGLNSTVAYQIGCSEQMAPQRLVPSHPFHSIPKEMPATLLRTPEPATRRNPKR
jgi:hypothetical protein